MLLLALVTISATVPPVRPTSLPECQRTTPQIAVERGKGPPMKKLNELPPANAYKAVYRQIGGCEVPVIVRYNVGGR